VEEKWKAGGESAQALAHVARAETPTPAAPLQSGIVSRNGYEHCLSRSNSVAYSQKVKRAPSQAAE